MYFVRVFMKRVYNVWIFYLPLLSISRKCMITLKIIEAKCSKDCSSLQDYFSCTIFYYCVVTSPILSKYFIEPFFLPGIYNFSSVNYPFYILSIQIFSLIRVSPRTNKNYPFIISCATTRVKRMMHER